MLQQQTSCVCARVRVGKSAPTASTVVRTPCAARWFGGGHACLLSQGLVKTSEKTTYGTAALLNTVRSASPATALAPPWHRRLGTAALAPPPWHRRLGTALQGTTLPGTTALAPPPWHRLTMHHFPAKPRVGCMIRFDLSFFVAAELRD